MLTALSRQNRLQVDAYLQKRYLFIISQYCLIILNQKLVARIYIPRGKSKKVDSILDASSTTVLNTFLNAPSQRGVNGVGSKRFYSIVEKEILDFFLIFVSFIF